MAAVSQEAKQRQRDRAKQYRQENKDKIREVNQRNNKARVAKYRANNHDKCLLSQTEYYTRNKEGILAQHKEYRDTTDGHKISNIKWYNANKHISRAINARRRAKIRRATVAWANSHTIKQIYAEAERLTKETGIEYVVDHMVPISSKVVCGLHCEFNLRVITATENGHKGNKLLPEFR